MALNKIKEWQLDLTETHKKINSLGKAVNFKGRVDSFNLLPTTGQDGDLWYVGPIEKENKEEYVWYDGKWELLGSSGALDIATTEEAKEGFDDSKVMTPLKTAQAIYENLGRVIQLGFDGTLTGNVLTFEPDIEGGYEIRNGYFYEIDLLFPAVVADGSLDENIEMVISNNGQTIKIVNALNDDISNNITVGDMKQIMKYTTDIGFRWIFNARFAIAQSGDKVFVIPSTVSNVGDGGVAEAVENQNEEKTTSPKVYTWVGTKAEYEEQKIATEHPDWLAYITDDYKDSDCFNQHNLLGGNDIEIIPEPVEGGIDEYTLSCFHLDGTAVDEVTGYTLSPTMDNSVHKFGTGSSMWTNSTSFPWSLNSYESFSFDYWYYHKTSRSSYLGLRKINLATYLLGLYFSSGDTKPKFRVIKDKYDIDVNFEANKWTHVYVYYNAEDRSFHLFVNGKEVFSLINSTDFSGVKEFANDGYTESRFDEIRISKCIRWTEDFEPPTQPYRKAEPTGNYVVNFTGKAGGNGKNIGEVYYSQSSLATDNAGALPLFTGETIASANTIYPDFYAWVESHAELQATAEEYETALSTYGECAKYVISDGSLRLPKLSNYIKMANTTDGITQSEAGLPNITGSVTDTYQMGNYGANVAIGSGALYSSKSAKGGTSQQSGNSIDIHMDASLSSEVYGKSDTVTPAHTTLYPWVYAFSASIPASTAQAAEFQQGLSGKADTNLGNIPTNYDYVVESYSDEEGNWYRVWKSKYLETGGLTASSSNITVTFLKPFAKINTIVCIKQRGGAQNHPISVSSYSNTEATFASAGDAAPIFWRAEGQGA